jgi:hypothetical protein
VGEDVGHGIFVCEPTHFGSYLLHRDGSQLLADWSNPQPESAHDATQSEANVGFGDFGRGVYQDRFLSGALQFVNHACAKCATHEALEWTSDKLGLLQRAPLLLPGLEVTMNYRIPEYDLWCQGPYCKRDDWVCFKEGTMWRGMKLDTGAWVPKKLAK